MNAEASHALPCAEAVQSRESLMAAAAQASRLLLESSDVLQSMPEVLQRIGEAAGVHRTTLALAALSLVPGCSNGGLDRADGPPTFTPPSSPYTPSTANPTPQQQTPVIPGNTNGGQTPDTEQPSNEMPDHDLPLQPEEQPGESQLGIATMGGSGASTERYHKTDVTRDGQNYFLMANGWGPGFHTSEDVMGYMFRVR
jgi:hypothetical protein